MEVEQQLTNKELRKNIFVIVWPVFVEVLLGALFGMVDMMMVGKVPGDTAAAVSRSEERFSCSWEDKPADVPWFKFDSSVERWRNCNYC